MNKAVILIIFTWTLMIALSIILRPLSGLFMIGGIVGTWYAIRDNIH